MAYYVSSCRLTFDLNFARFLAFQLGPVTLLKVSPVLAETSCLVTRTLLR